MIRSGSPPVCMSMVVILVQCSGSCQLSGCMYHSELSRRFSQILTDQKIADLCISAKSAAYEICGLPLLTDAEQCVLTTQKYLAVGNHRCCDEYLIRKFIRRKHFKLLAKLQNHHVFILGCQIKFAVSSNG